VVIPAEAGIQTRWPITRRPGPNCLGRWLWAPAFAGATPFGADHRPCLLRGLVFAAPQRACCKLDKPDFILDPDFPSPLPEGEVDGRRPAGEGVRPRRDWLLGLTLYPERSL